MILLRWAIIALVVSVIAGLLGFTGIASGAAIVARVLFGIFLTLTVLLLILVALGIGALKS